jgi:hypothetical protein
MGEIKGKRIRRGLARRPGRPGPWLAWTPRRRLKNKGDNQWSLKLQLSGNKQTLYYLGGSISGPPK